MDIHKIREKYCIDATADVKKKIKTIRFKELEQKGSPVRKIDVNTGLLMMPPQVRSNLENFIAKGGDPNKWNFKFINVAWSASTV